MLLIIRSLNTINENVLRLAHSNSSTSTRAIAQLLRISEPIVWRILSVNQMNPYNLQSFQASTLEDYQPQRNLATSFHQYSTTDTNKVRSPH
ncbi:hypothetical protein NPIL_204451 [Nephila pilipes]|uniref:Uncharacterized protein n=1 Tax=Nephila pilipes TaxID=299642 RepID=A0A8X6P8P9_NEPPI|nr:hypothetical protein NPIL_204451 [Nephila pilipes]